MTIGSKLLTNWSPSSTQCGGEGNVGTRRFKTWSGVDGSRKVDHPYSMKYYEEHDHPIIWNNSPPMEWPYNPGPFTGTYRSCFGGINAPFLAFEPSDEYKLIEKLETRFKGHSFNAAVNLGELNESIRMISSTAKTLAKTFLSLKRGDPVKALQLLSLKPTTSRVSDVKADLSMSAAQAWLGLTYGWVPLVGAVKDAADAAASQLFPRKTTIRATRKVSAGQNETSVHMIWKVEEEARFTTLEEFGFISPELVAWELLPYSFVVDWFTPIGSFLQSRATLNSIKGTYVRSERRRAIAYGVLPSGFSSTTIEAYDKQIELIRTVGTISQLPLPAPKLKNPYSLSHTFSALSLLRVAFS